MSQISRPQVHSVLTSLGNCKIERGRKACRCFLLVLSLIEENDVLINGESDTKPSCRVIIFVLIFKQKEKNVSWFHWFQTSLCKFSPSVSKLETTDGIETLRFANCQAASYCLLVSRKDKLGPALAYRTVEWR